MANTMSHQWDDANRMTPMNHAAMPTPMPADNDRWVPLLCIDAPRTLQNQEIAQMTIKKDKLFRIISWICKYLQIKSSSNTIMTLNQNSMFICYQKIIIEENFPLSMEKFSITVGYHIFVGSLTTSIVKSKFLERAWKLERHFKWLIIIITATHCLEVCYMIA
jgi:hypothetical protein